MSSGFAFLQNIQQLIQKNVRIITAYAIGIGCSALTLKYFVEINTSEGLSMLPTLSNVNDVFIIDKSAKWRKTFRKGDIVISTKFNDDYHVCKRIIGVGGDVLLDKNNNKTPVPEGHFWLEGDNTTASIDSRAYGAVPENMLIGKVIYRIFPNTGPIVNNYKPITDPAQIEHIKWYEKQKIQAVMDAKNAPKNITKEKPQSAT